MHNAPQQVPIRAVLHLPPQAIFALIWQRAQVNAYTYQKEFDKIGIQIKREAELQALRTQSLPRIDIHKKPTKKITTTHSAITNFLNCPLPLDEHKCAYVHGSNALLSTFDLVKLLVQQFYEKMHCYPAIIFLSASRWNFGQIMKSFIAEDGTTIPYAQGNEFDVCVKSAPLGDPLNL